LKELDFANNKLFFSQETTLKEFGKIKTLVKLDLTNNQLEEIPPEFSNLTSLQTLIIANNSLKNFPIDLGLIYFPCVCVVKKLIFFFLPPFIQEGLRA
jgi:Leucine-rich repeat (LRR) protein